jgi:hypothetical protein
MPNCLSCGAFIDEFDSAYYSRNMTCISCYSTKAAEDRNIPCSRCGTGIRRSESRERHGEIHCAYCFSEEERQARIPTCPICSTRVEEWQASLRAPDGKIIHTSCRDNWNAQAMRVHSGRAAKDGAGTILGMMMRRVGAMLG